MDTRHSDLDNEPGFGGAPLVEVTARIVALDRGRAWLEPEPGTNGVSTIASRLQNRRCWLTLNFPAGTTIGNAIARAGLTNSFPEVDFESHKVGIFGKLASLETLLADGDRVEIYRPLTVDPKTVKRKPKAAAAESEQV